MEEGDGVEEQKTRVQSQHGPGPNRTSVFLHGLILNWSLDVGTDYRYEPCFFES
jgi:hypothetical protein